MLATALYAIALSVPALDVWPDAWRIPVNDNIEKAIGVNDDTVVCIALASLVLGYWGAAEGRRAAADLVRIAGFLSGLPWVTTIGGWLVKGTAFMFKTLRQKATDLIREEARTKGLAEGLAEGRAEGKAAGRAEEAEKWRAWLERRIADNPDLWDENDPPPPVPPKE